MSSPAQRVRVARDPQQLQWHAQHRVFAMTVCTTNAAFVLLPCENATVLWSLIPRVTICDVTIHVCALLAQQYQSRSEDWTWKEAPASCLNSTVQQIGLYQGDAVDMTRNGLRES